MTHDSKLLLFFPPIALIELAPPSAVSSVDTHRDYSAPVHVPPGIDSLTYPIRGCAPNRVDGVGRRLLIRRTRHYTNSQSWQMRASRVDFSRPQRPLTSRCDATPGPGAPDAISTMPSITAVQLHETCLSVCSRGCIQAISLTFPFGVLVAYGQMLLTILPTECYSAVSVQASLHPQDHITSPGL